MGDTAPVTPPTPGRPPLFTRDYILTTVGTFSFFASFMYLLSVLPDYVDEIGGAEWQVGLVVGGFGLLPLLIRPHVGRWCDEGNRLRLMRLGTVVFALALFLMVFSQDVWSLLALAPGAGDWHGAVADVGDVAGGGADPAVAPRRGAGLLRDGGLGGADHDAGAGRGDRR